MTQAISALKGIRKMTEIEQAVADHYGDKGLLGRIYEGLEKKGVDIKNLKPEDISPVDEFHIGGRAATIHAVGKMSLGPDDHVLDVGCGIGGAARFMASEKGCRVTGIDLTPEFISTANILSTLTGLDERVHFDIASALNMPFESRSFDAAITFHVAMNIAQRIELYEEIFRVMKPGATLCIYDVMKKNDDDLVFPLPWAATQETSFLTTPDEMIDLLNDAGFDVQEVEDRTEFAKDFFKNNFAADNNGPPPLGIHLVVGADPTEKFQNLLRNIEAGRISPVVMTVTRR